MYLDLNYESIILAEGSDRVSTYLLGYKAQEHYIGHTVPKCNNAVCKWLCAMETLLYFWWCAICPLHILGICPRSTCLCFSSSPRGGPTHWSVCVPAGALMTLAWLFFSSVGVVAARHCKSLVDKNRLFGLHYWFVVNKLKSMPHGFEFFILPICEPTSIRTHFYTIRFSFIRRDVFIKV